MKRHMATTAALALAATLGGCVGGAPEHPIPHEQRATAVEISSSERRSGVDESAIEAFGFKVYWDSLIRDEVITSLTMEGDQLYAFTRSQRLFQIDVHSGMVNWVYDVGRELSFTDGGHPIAEWVYHPRPGTNFKQYDEVFFCADSYLYALDKRNGSELWEVQLPFTPSSAPDASATHVFVGAWNDRVYGIQKDEPLIPDWSWRTQGDVTARPVYTSPTVFASSQDGNLYAFDAASGRVKWPLKTDRKLLRDPVIYRKLLYVPAEDFNMYVVGVNDGLIHHRFCAGAPITTRPVGIDKTIYVGAEGKGMFAIKRTGFPPASKGNPRKVGHELIWEDEASTQVLCKGMEDVYLLAPGAEGSGKFQVRRIHAENGTERGVLDLDSPRVDFFVTNPFDPNGSDLASARRGGILFLGFRNGWIVAVKEAATIPGA